MADPKTYSEEEYAAIVKERDALKAKRDEVLDEAKDAKKELKGLRAELTELQQAAKGQKAGVTAEDLKNLRAEVLADLEKQYAPTKEQAATLAAENRRLKLDNVVKAAMAKGGARAERIDALFKLTQDQFDLTDDGQPMLKDRKGTPVEKFVSEDLKALYPEFYNGSGSRGGGASRSAAGGGSTTTIAADDGKGLLANLEAIAKGEVLVQQ